MMSIVPKGYGVTFNSVDTGIVYLAGIIGPLLAAILAAVMSTLSCQLLVCSSALTEDIYRTFLRKNAGQPGLVWVGRPMVMAMPLVAIGLSGNPETQVLGLDSHA